MLGGRSSEQWIAQYASSHTHPVNRLCHSLGIPLIVVSLALAVAAVFYHPLWMLAAGLFVFGWLLQFIGHAFERKQPEFFHDWRFLLVGVRWWWAKMRGRALGTLGSRFANAITLCLCYPFIGSSERCGSSRWVFDIPELHKSTDSQARFEQGCA
jgi:uncharacterized membrane protein YGL010W